MDNSTKVASRTGAAVDPEITFVENIRAKFADESIADLPHILRRYRVSKPFISNWEVRNADKRSSL